MKKSTAKNTEVATYFLKLRLRDIKPLLRAGRGCRYERPLVWRNSYGEEQLSVEIWYYSEYIKADTDFPEVIGLRFRNSYGQVWEQDICVTTRESNLGRGEVYYFVCPVTARLCRTLYYTGIEFRSLYSFPHSYDIQRMSRTEREERWAYEEPPSIYRRKLSYRGKLTPFGRKYLKAEEKCRAATAKLFRGFEAGLLKKRGK